MKHVPNFGKIVFLVLLLGSVVLATAGYRAFQGNLSALNASDKEPIDWSALQLEIELLKFNSELIRFVAETPGVTPQTVNNRFDILWSRIGVFQRGNVGQRLSNYTGTAAVVDQLLGEMKRQENLVVALEPGDLQTAKKLEETFSAFANDIRLMSRTVYLGELGVDAQMRDRVRDAAYLAAYASVAFFLLSLLALIYINRESRRFQILARANRKLADAADAANVAKSKFLAMMSHELRTPMNGVLGTLSLAQQSGLPPAQQRLLERAEKSGRQMTTMLSDILDFSALQDDRLELEQKVFETHLLNAALDELFAPVALREQISFAVKSASGCPSRVTGDFKRIRQSLSHLTAYIVETAGTKDVDIELGSINGQLMVTISFEYTSTGGTWQPDLVLGNVERSKDQFASDALGPSVARALIQKMGGAIKLDTPSENRISILVTVGAKAVDIKELEVRLELSSSALNAVCRAALAQPNVVFQDEGSNTPPHLVLTDCGNERSGAGAHELQAQYPGAMLVSVGEPVQPDLFDSWIKMPIDVLEVRTQILDRLVG